MGAAARTVLNVALAAVAVALPVAVAGAPPAAAASPSLVAVRGDHFSDGRAAVVRRPSGRIDVLYRSTAGTLHHASSHAGGHYEEQDVGGTVTGEPAAVVVSDRRVAEVHRDGGGRLVGRVLDGGAWGPESDLGVVSDGNPSAIRTADGVVHVFTRTGGTLLHLWRGEADVGAAGAWPVEDLGVPALVDPTSVAGGIGGLSVFTSVERFDRSYPQWTAVKVSWTGTVWRTSVIGGSRPTVVALPGNRIGAAHWGGDGGIIARTYDPVLKWIDRRCVMGGNAIGVPEAATDGDQLWVVAANVKYTDGVYDIRLHARRNTAGESLRKSNAHMAGPPVALNTGPGRYAVFYRGQAGQLVTVDLDTATGFGRLRDIATDFAR